MHKQRLTSGCTRDGGRVLKDSWVTRAARVILVVIPFEHLVQPTIAEYAETVACLDDHKRRRFYETLALNLTVSARVVWSDDKLSDSEKVEQLKQLNEKQHRLIGKLLDTHQWSDIDFLTTFLSISECTSIAGHLGWAVKRSLDCVTKSTSEV